MLKNYRRFLARNRNKGIPNLMLYLCLANAFLYLFVLITGNNAIYTFLRYDPTKILQGQIWRIGTWLLTYGIEAYSGSFMGILYIFFYIMFYNWLGQILESVWGSLRLNLYYFGGALITVIVSLLFWVIGDIPIFISAEYLNLSLMIAVATLIPEERIMLFGVFPFKLRWLAWLDIGLILINLLPMFAHLDSEMAWMVLAAYATAPLISLLNYFLNFGKGVSALLPRGMNLKQVKRRQEFKRASRPNPNWSSNYRSSSGQRPYRHKCTVCGRTDTENPGLEFRYCSRCKGYYCYCTDHINNHTHVE